VAKINEQPLRTWRQRAIDTLWWVAFAGFVVTLPISFPILIVYKKLRGERIRGKGTAFFVLIWFGMTAFLALILAAYAKKGFAGIQTLLWIAIAGTIWAFVVFVMLRLLLEAIVLIAKMWGWANKKFRK
jgi:hypothetical protein